METLVFTKFDQNKLSLNELTCQFADQHDVEISKQGIDQRFSEFSVNFMKAVLEKLLKKIIREQAVIEFLKDFNSVRIKDSTAFQLPPDMVNKFPGSGGSASKAQIRIQFEYDCRTGKIYDLSLHAFNDQDTTDAKNTLSSVAKNDLIIRDLGYVVIDVLKEIDNREAWFMNRFNFSSNAYEKKGKEYYKLVNFGKIQKYMNKNGVDRIEKEVFLGTKKTLKVRMIIERLPKEQIEFKLRKEKEKARRKGRELSDKSKAHIGLNVYITNIPSEKLPSTKLRILYSLRWQVELIFKVWKTVGEIHKVKKMKVERFETMLYAKLIWITLNWGILWEISKSLWQTKKIILSPIKIFTTMKNRIEKFRLAIERGTTSIVSFIMTIYKLSPKKHQLEKKKNKISSKEIIMLFCEK